jgi:cell division protein ZapA
MNNVTLTIGGRSFTVATADGEEAHILGLGRMIDSKLAAMGEQTALSESRMLLFAALLLADELHEARRGGEAGARASGEEAGRRLEQIAARLENLAERLEGQGASA